MLKICPKLLGQIFEEPPSEEEILSFIRDLGHTGEIKFLSDVMHQPWRSLASKINKCLSRKATTLESLRLSRAQILWGMYYNKKVDYVYVLWEDLVFQVENKNSKKDNDMDDFMFTTVRVISKHQDTQVYDAILPQHLTNQAMLESEAYMTYCAYATCEKTPKQKSTKKKDDFESSLKIKPTQDFKGIRIKTSAKGDKPVKMKKFATKSKGLTVLSEAALSEADQMKLETERSKKEFHISHTSSSGNGVDILSKVLDEQQQTVYGTNEGAGDKPEVLDVPEYRSKSEEESWTFSQGDDDVENDEHDSEDDNDEHDSANDNDDKDDDQENVSGETESDDDGDNFVYPNLFTYNADDQEKEDEEEKANDDDDEVSSDQKVSTPPDYEILDKEDNQEDDDKVMGGEQEDEELYEDLNLNLDR
uniref:Uncharacterized protein n=1 Tax=Tanacetum cinerariifolium TaxID=118510 RepID=A0A6L2K4Y7_TANCI|nr:hypothetical protein [Tanacetum cinerariifolium]